MCRVKKILRFMTGGCVLFLLSLGASANSHLEERVSKMEAELQQIKQAFLQQKQMYEKEITQLQKKLHTVSATAQKSQAKKSTDGSILKLGKNTTLKYGGYVRVNGMFDDYSDGNAPSAAIASRILVPSLIPVGGESTESTEFNSDVATSRFNFGTKTTTSHGDIRSFFELDFLSGGGDERISNSNNPRLRHAFFAWDYSDNASLLLGQTWSTFFNVGALPETVEFIGPTSGTIFNRQVQMRWTKKWNNGSNMMLALENPSTSIYDGGSGVSGNNFDDNSVPDFVARYNGKFGNHSYSVAALLRQISADTGSVDESKFSAAVNLAGKYTLANGDDIKYSLAYGNLGRYIALNAYRDGSIDASGNLDLTNIFGGYIAYRHNWNDRWRSTVQYAYSSADLPNGVASSTTESLQNYSLNLLYSPFKALTFGGELIRAERELDNGQDGDLTRLQFFSRYAF